MDRSGPTRKFSKKRVHLLRWTTFPGPTGWNFGWMDRAPGSQSLVGSELFHLGCIPDSKAQDSRFHKQKYMGRTYFTGTYVFQWYRSESYHIRHARGVKKLHSPFWADWGRFPFDKHSDLKFRKIYVTNATVHSRRTYPTQAAARLVIALVSRILACSRLRDSGEKSFSKKKWEKRAGAGERPPPFPSRARLILALLV